jgi:flagellar biosynthesis/type III secretory pathway M-ring protein FliF/YscJ
MNWAETLNKYPSIMYLTGGLLIGLFIGYQVLPKLLPRKTAPLTTAELQSVVAMQEQLEAKLAASITAIDGVGEAQVQLSTPLSGSRRIFRKASVTVAATDAPLSNVQVAAITEVVASGIDDLKPGNVTVFGSAGRALNLEVVQEHEQKQFWTNIAINVSKILGILAAMITVRYIIQAIQKKMRGETQGC